MKIQALVEYLNLNSEAIYNGDFRKSNKPVVVKCIKCKRYIKIPYSEKKWHWLNDTPILCKSCNNTLFKQMMERIAKTVFNPNRKVGEIVDKDIS